MKKSLAIVALLLIAVVGIGCPAGGGATKTEELQQSFGVEIGNPIIGKSVRVVPITGSFAYLVTIDSGTTASMQQLTKAITAKAVEKLATTVETVTSTTITEADGRVFVSATFSNGEKVDMRLALSTAGTVIAVAMELNGATVEITFDLQAMADCTSSTTNAALKLADVACSKIVECVPELTCLICNANVLAVMGLGESFGASVDQAWDTIAIAVGEGALVADSAQLATCLTDVSAVTCPQALTVVEAGSINYSKIKEVIPSTGACPLVF